MSSWLILKVKKESIEIEGSVSEPQYYLYCHEEFELSLFKSSGEVFNANKSYSERVASTVDTVQVEPRSLLKGKRQLPVWKLKTRLVIWQSCFHLDVCHVTVWWHQFKVIRQSTLSVRVHPLITHHPTFWLCLPNKINKLNLYLTSYFLWS